MELLKVHLSQVIKSQVIHDGWSLNNKFSHISQLSNSIELLKVHTLQVIKSSICG
jgi:hypothetical protein